MSGPLTPLLTRRSTAVKDLADPAPNDDELKQILTVATRVPDHGKLCPWRIKILRHHGQRKLGEIAAQYCAATYPQVTEAHRAAELQRFHRAPLVLAVLSTPIPDSKPVWEQQLSAGAVCMNILHAAHALGYGAKWLTEWVAYEPAIIEALGGKADDNIAGFIYLGTKTLETPDRGRPKLSDVVVEWP